MRIGIDIRSLIEPFPSGISEYTFKIVKNLLKNNKSGNKYILFYNAQKNLSKRYLDEFKKYPVEIKSTHWPNKLYNLLLFLNIYIRINKVLGGVDIFYMPNINFYSISNDTKLILTVHDLSFEYPKYFSLKPRFWHKFINPKKIITQADKIIAVSNNTKQDIINNYQVAENKIEVIYSGVDLDKFNNLSVKKSQDVKMRYKITDDYFLFLGNLENRKNITSIIKAWYLLKSKDNIKEQLVMAGRINNKSIVDEFPEVIFTGYISEDEKPYLYSMARAFIYPSFYEGFGLPVIEAMAAGCPVITSFSTSLPEIASQAAIYVDPYNINECAKAMKILLEDGGLRKFLVSNGRALVKKYNWENTIQQMIQIFNEI